LVLAFLLAASATLPPYPEALRCAALSQAAFEPVKNASGPQAAARYDRLIFWSMAASEAARKDKRAASAFEAELAAAAKKAAWEFRSAGSGALDELARCDARVPPLEPGRR
jgi:hypothetical protein